MNSDKVEAGDLVLIPARVLTVGDRMIAVATEEPPEGEGRWPVLVVQAEREVRLYRVEGGEAIKLREAA